MLVLAVNPGSTSTKIAVFQDELCLWKNIIEHPVYGVGWTGGPNNLNWWTSPFELYNGSNHQESFLHCPG